MVTIDKFPQTDEALDMFATNRKREQFRRLNARGDGCVTAKGELVKVLEFTHFYEHFTFDKTDWSDRGKHLKKYIRVIVAVELVTVGAKNEPVRLNK